MVLANIVTSRYEQEVYYPKQKDDDAEYGSENENETILKVYDSANPYRPKLLNSVLRSWGETPIDMDAGNIQRLVIEYKNNRCTMPDRFVKRLSGYLRTGDDKYSTRTTIDCHPFAYYMSTGDGAYLEGREVETSDVSHAEIIFEGIFADIDADSLRDIVDKNKLGTGDVIMLYNSYDVYDKNYSHHAAEASLQQTIQSEKDLAMNELKTNEEGVYQVMDHYILSAVTDKMIKLNKIGAPPLESEYNSLSDADNAARLRSYLLASKFLDADDLSQMDSAIGEYCSKNNIEEGMNVREYVGPLIEGNVIKSLYEKIETNYRQAIIEPMLAEINGKYQNVDLGNQSEWLSSHSMVYLGIEDLVLSKFGRTPIEISSLYGVIDFYRKSLRGVNPDQLRESRIQLRVYRAKH